MEEKQNNFYIHIASAKSSYFELLLGKVVKLILRTEVTKEMTLVMSL